MQAADKGMLQNGDSAGPTLLGAEAALRVVAEQLPKIVPNMLINKRDGEGRCLHACCPARVPFETVRSPSSHVAILRRQCIFMSEAIASKSISTLCVKQSIGNMKLLLRILPSQY